MSDLSLTDGGPRESISSDYPKRMSAKPFAGEPVDLDNRTIRRSLRLREEISPKPAAQEPVIHEDRIMWRRSSNLVKKSSLKPPVQEPMAQEPAISRPVRKLILPRSEGENVLMRREAVQRRQNAELATLALIDAGMESMSHAIHELKAERKVLKRKYEETITAEYQAKKVRLEAGKQLLNFEDEYQVGHEELRRKAEALEKQHEDWMEKCSEDVEQLKKQVAKRSKNSLDNLGSHDGVQE